MESTLNIKGTIIRISCETQLSKLGRPFRLSSIRLCTDEPAKWINKQLVHKTIYTFRFIDTEGGYISFKFDHNNAFEKIETNETN